MTLEINFKLRVYGIDSISLESLQILCKTLQNSASEEFKKPTNVIETYVGPITGW